MKWFSINKINSGFVYVGHFMLKVYKVESHTIKRIEKLKAKFVQVKLINEIIHSVMTVNTNINEKLRIRCKQNKTIVLHFL